MVIALVIGVILNPWVDGVPAYSGPAWFFASERVLRGAVALLGIRVGVGEIMALGTGNGGPCRPRHGSDAGRGHGLRAVQPAKPVLRCAGRRRHRRVRRFGDACHRDRPAQLSGQGSPISPSSSSRPIALATLAMVVYPPLCAALGFDAQATGVMLGGTIHDVAQVVGAGYSVSVDGRQYRRHRQAVPRVAAAADGARHRLVS